MKTLIELCKPLSIERTNNILQRNSAIGDEEHNYNLSVSTYVEQKDTREKMNNEIKFLIYSLPDNRGEVSAIVKDETIWTTQKGMAELFDVNTPANSKHSLIYMKKVNYSRKQLFPKWK